MERTRPVRLSVRTSGFHPGKRGSTPLRATIDKSRTWRISNQHWSELSPLRLSALEISTTTRLCVMLYVSTEHWRIRKKVRRCFHLWLAWLTSSQRGMSSTRTKLETWSPSFLSTWWQRHKPQSTSYWRPRLPQESGFFVYYHFQHP